MKTATKTRSKTTPQVCSSSFVHCVPLCGHPTPTFGRIPTHREFNRTPAEFNLFQLFSTFFNQNQKMLRWSPSDTKRRSTADNDTIKSFAPNCSQLQLIAPRFYFSLPRLQRIPRL